MKKISPTKLLFGFLGLATFASLIGSVSGSLAWYAYSTRASLSYTGTSVERTAQLQIGVISPVAITYAANEMVEDTTITDAQNNHYYFAPIGSGLTSSILSKYLEANGYAKNFLVPITSGYYKPGETFALRKAPNLDGYYHNEIQSAATKDQYAYFKFIFRVAKDSHAAVVEYIPNHEIWLTEAKARPSFTDQGDVSKALRVFVDRDDNNYGYDYIFNPSATQKGETKVGGLLDLGRDGTYDYDSNNNEIIFGEYNQAIADSKRTANYQGANELVDVNGSGATTHDTFTAKHEPGVNYYTKEKLEECEIKTAEYESINDILPEKNSITGELQNVDSTDPTSVCTTADSGDSYIARVNMAIYLEGWDFSVIDEEIGHLFDLGLTFEINKVAAND